MHWLLLARGGGGRGGASQRDFEGKGERGKVRESAPQWMERPSVFMMEFIVGVVEGIFEDQVRVTHAPAHPWRPGGKHDGRVEGGFQD